MDHWWEGKMLLVDALMPLVSTLALNFEAPVYAMLDGANASTILQVASSNVLKTFSV
tara:strand:+ start:528 stop:698 length:171 start_codon:yes stop_codon:yes gene_type:complete